MSCIRPTTYYLNANCEICNLAPHFGFGHCFRCSVPLPGSQLQVEAAERGVRLSPIIHLVPGAEFIVCGACGNGFDCECPESENLPGCTMTHEGKYCLPTLHVDHTARCMACTKEMNCPYCHGGGRKVPRLNIT